MTQLDKLKEKLSESISSLWERIENSEAYQQLRAKYDDLEPQKKLALNIGFAVGVVLLILSPLFYGLGSLRGLKGDLETREELIGYLQAASDRMRQYRAQSAAQSEGQKIDGPFNQWAEEILISSNIDRTRAEIGAEQVTQDTKEYSEIALDMKISQINLRQLTRLLFQFTEKGKPLHLVVRDLTVDTKNELTGFLDTTLTLVAYKAK